MTSRRPVVGWWRLLALLAILGLIAAACGGGGDDGGETTTEEPATETDGDGGTETSDEPAPEPADNTDDDDSFDEAPTGTEDEEPTELEPVYGGSAAVLVEAETDTWNIPNANCATSCITVMRAVADPMTIMDENGEAQPFVVESFEANDDFTQFTIRMRDNVFFHDGTQADGEAVRRTIAEMKAGLLQGQLLLDLDVETGLVLIDDMTVQVTFNVPYATFPEVMSERTGYLLAPSFWDIPNADRGNAFPVGTGAFTMTEWTPGEQTVLSRFDNYWRTDAEGRQLPYLDELVVRPIPDVATRRATMESGDADLNSDSFHENADFWRNDWIEEGGKLVEQPDNRATTYLLLNNAAPPFDDPDFRRALALCTNRDEFILVTSPGATKANGPFSPGALGFLEDTGLPDFDPEAGSALLDDIGRQPVVYGTTDVPSNLLTAQLFADQWSRNCGLDVTIDQFAQAELINKAIFGDFQVFLWRNHGEFNPALQEIWWHSRHAEGLALNFGRIINPAIDDLLTQMWSTTDQSELDQLGQGINREMGENVHNLWLHFSSWNNAYVENLHNVDRIAIPGGGTTAPSVDGRMYLAEVWKS